MSTDNAKVASSESADLASINKSPIRKYEVHNDLAIRGNQDPSSWTDLLEPILPAELRGGALEYAHMTASWAGDTSALPHIIVEARRRYNINVLHHLGIALGRWEALFWVVQNLPKTDLLGHPYNTPESQLARIWSGSNSLDDLTLNAVSLSFPPTCPPTLPDTYQHGYVYRAENLGSLDRITARFGDVPRNENESMYRKALGQVWQSLGTMILAAVQKEGEASKTIMSNVLRIIAHLHHIGIIPPSVYTYNPSQDVTALQQPPTLQLLSSRILASLSDVTMNAHKPPYADEASVSHILYQDNEIVLPGARYARRIQDLGPEVWLELILWSCVHGGWLVEGVSILSEMKKYKDTERWRLISWRDILAAPGPEYPSSYTLTWDELSARFHANVPKLRHEPTDRSHVERTISSEIVTAFIDGLINSIHVGVGNRGTRPRPIVEHILALKSLLDRDQLNLESSSWNAVIVRLLESEGINVEGDPVLVEQILSLSPAYGTELSSVNAPLNPTQADLTPSYIFDGSAAPLGIYHRVLQAFIDREDVAGALQAFKALDSLTDYNKRKSVEDFFQELKTAVHGKEAKSTVSFESNISRIDFPAFYTQIPSQVLSSLLDLVTEAGEYDFGKWMLYSNEVDGPTIPERMYGDLRLAGSILNFASATKDKSLLLRVTNALKNPSNFEAYPDIANEGGDIATDQQPSKVVSSLILQSLRSRISRGKWDAIQEILDYMSEVHDYKWTALTLTQVITDLVRYGTPYLGQRDISDATTEQVHMILKRLRGGSFGSLEHIKPEQFDSILGVLSSMDTELAEFCFDLTSRRQPLKVDLPPRAFNAILETVVALSGGLEAKRLWDIWCESPGMSSSQSTVKEGGIAPLPRYRVDRAQELLNRPQNVVVQRANGQSFEYAGCVSPSIRTVLIIVRNAIRKPGYSSSAAASSPQEAGTSGGQRKQDSPSLDNAELSDAQKRDLLEWAMSTLRRMRMSDVAIDNELGGYLAELGLLDQDVKGSQQTQGAMNTSFEELK